jgi:hypothetical protein
LLDGWFHIGLPDPHTDCACLAGVLSQAYHIKSITSSKLDT